MGDASAAGPAVSSLPPPASRAGSTSASAQASAPGGEPCPRCGAPRTDRFCEDCGYDFVTGTGRAAPVPSPTPGPAPVPVPPPPDPAAGPAAGAAPDVAVDTPAGTWIAVIEADRAYYDRVIELGGPDSVALRFPPYTLERRLILTGDQVRIGRRSVSQGLAPEIDLGQPPEDPGVSHLHAVLLAQPDGSWVLVDPGSTNGTTLNDSDEPVEVNAEIPLKQGDQIHVGAWTSITLTKEG
ncbi:FHA domain-containing protein [Flindersiella endophytica]